METSSAAMAHPASDPAGVYSYDHEDTKQYIERNGVKTLMAMLLKDVVVEKPEDPISFMIKKCESLTDDDYMPPPPSDAGEEVFAYDDGAISSEGQPDGEELQEMVLDLFLQADADENGYLDRRGRPP